MGKRSKTFEEVQRSVEEAQKKGFASLSIVEYNLPIDYGKKLTKLGYYVKIEFHCQHEIVMDVFTVTW